MEWAYAVLDVKSVDQGRRRIRGTATTPQPDRRGDVLEPLGATFAAEMPLLLHHQTDRPVGVARFDPPTRQGITFEAELPIITEPGPVKDEVDRAWTSILHKLIRGVSIGFQAAEDGIEYLKTGGRRLRKTEILELSLVTVPANQAATMAIVKSLDQAASGRSSAPAPGPVRTRAGPMTTTEQIQQFENTRAAKVARLETIMSTTATKGETTDDAAATECDEITAEVKRIDADLVRFRDLERFHQTTATPITKAIDPTSAAARRGGVISVRPNVPQGTAFVRAACALLVCNGNRTEAAAYAEQRWKDSTPEVPLYLKAAVAPGTSTDATWAGPLVTQTLAADFLELLRPATILGKISGMRVVPFNCKVPAQTAGGTYGWVGESKPKPVTKLAFAAETLGITKAAGIIVLTEELVRLSNPSAEALCRADMIAGIAQFLDTQFIDPAVAAVAGVNPASITNGAPTAAATVNPLADIMGLIGHFATNNISVDGVHFIMSPANALSLAFRSNLDGSPEFPGITINGGSYRGLTFVTSGTAGTNVVAVQPSLILFADDGGVSIDASREASLQMDSAPASPADATTVYVSLWQTNTVGLRAERFVNWKRANANAVKYLTATAWPAPSGAQAMTESGPVRKG